MFTRVRLGMALALLVPAGLGCAGGQPFYNVEGLWMARGVAADTEQPSPKKENDENGKNGNGKNEKSDKTPKTLFNWSIGPDTEPEESEAEEEDEIVTDRPDFT